MAVGDEPSEQSTVAEEATDEKSPDGKSAIRFVVSGAEQNAEPSAEIRSSIKRGKSELAMSSSVHARSMAEPNLVDIESAKPIKPSSVVRSRVSVMRLSDAEPSSYSSDLSDDSNLIVKASNEEPILEPFAEEELQLTKPKARASERAVQAGMQAPRSGFEH